jgi:hypothetical protein
MSGKPEVKLRQFYHKLHAMSTDIKYILFSNGKLILLSVQVPSNGFASDV